MLEILILAAAYIRRLIRTRYLTVPVVAAVLLITCFEAVEVVGKAGSVFTLAAVSLVACGIQMVQDEHQGFHLAVRSMGIHINRLFISRFLSTVLLFLTGYIARTVLLNIL